jgi:hypothetical protein
MFDHPKASLADFTDQKEIEVISTFLRDNPWEDCFDETDMPPKWVIDWSRHWKVDFLWDLEMGEILASGYLIHVESTGESFFSDLHYDGCSGFERISGPGSPLTVDQAWAHTSKYWEEIMTDSLVYGEFRLIETKWLPRDRVEAFLADLLKKSNFNKMEGGEGPTLEEWIKREYDSPK